MQVQINWLLYQLFGICRENLYLISDRTTGEGNIFVKDEPSLCGNEPEELVLLLQSSHSGNSFMNQNPGNRKSRQRPQRNAHTKQLNESWSNSLIYIL